MGVIVWLATLPFRLLLALLRRRDRARVLPLAWLLFLVFLVPGVLVGYLWSWRGGGTLIGIGAAFPLMELWVTQDRRRQGPERKPRSGRQDHGTMFRH